MARCFDFRSCLGARFPMPGAITLLVHSRGEGRVGDEQRNHICFVSNKEYYKQKARII